MTNPTFPIRTTLYLHGDKGGFWYQGEELGLPEHSLDDFSRCLYEVAFEVDVYRDGSITILSVNGQPLQSESL